MTMTSDPADRNLVLRLATVIVAANVSAAQAPSSSLFCLGFSTTPPPFRGPPQLAARNGQRRRANAAFPLARFSGAAPLRAQSSSSGNANPPPLPKTDDPFLLLGLDAPTSDPKEIKRAYRKRAMKYHPDVVLGSESTAEERNKASKEFARINAAYAMLTGEGKGSVGARSGSGRSATSSGGYDYKPPHRRTTGYSSSPYGQSTDWEDYMPKYDEEDAKYDASGDSFGSIFSDMLTGAAGYAAGVSGGGGVMGDFIEFLENNMNVDSGYDNENLFQYASFDEVADEMDETDILVTSLETKLSKVQNDLVQAQADLNSASKFSEKLDLEERVAELKAREKVSKDYLKRGKKRLIQLRERYKALVVEGRGGKAYGGGSGGRTSVRNTRDDSSWDTTNTNSAPANHGPATPRSSSPPTSSTSSTPSAPKSSSTNSWRNEGFSGSYERRSSGSRRRHRNTGASSTSNTTASRTPPSPSSAPASPSTKSWRDEGFSSSYRGRSSASRASRSDAGGKNADVSSAARPGEPSTQQRRRPDDSTSRRTVPQRSEPFVPPHRRTRSLADRASEDKKRLRELKVEDEFDKLKRELGL